MAYVIDSSGQKKTIQVTTVSNLSDISDVAITAVADNEVLAYDSGGNWINQTAAEAGLLTALLDDTTPQLGGQLDVNGNAIGDGTRELLTFTEDASAVNHVNIENEATGSGPIISAAGDDANIDLNINAKGTGNISLGNYTLDADATVGAGQDDYVLTYDNASGTISLEASTGGLSNVVEDTTPQLGGQLDINGNAIGDGTRELLTFTEDASAVNHVNIENEATGSGPIISAAGDDVNVDLNISAKGSGNIALGNFTFDADATVGAGQDNYVLTYDNAGGLISLEASSGGIADIVDDTTPQLGGQLDVNGNAIGDGTRELLTFTEDASAVNHVNIENEATGSGPIISAAGDDANVDLIIDGKGSGVVKTASSNLDITGNIVVSGTVDGRDVATDGTKLDGIEASADVTDETNVVAALSGATLTDITAVAADKVLLQDASDTDNLRTETASAIANLADDLATSVITSGTFADARIAASNVTQHEASINHDALTGFVANEHIDWTAASSNFSTSGTIDCTGTEAVKLPVGTTAQRPGTPAEGDMRVNTTIGTTEIYRGAAWVNLETGGGLGSLLEDTTPQLGGQLDVNGNAIGDGTRELLTFTEDASAVNHVNIENEATGSGPIISAAGDDTNVDLNINAKGTGNISIGNFTFDADQSVGAGQDNYVLTYDNAGGVISLEAAAGGGGGGAECETSVAQTSHGLAVGDLVKCTGADTYAEAQADSAANAEVVGIVSAVADANNFTLLTAGEVDGLSGLTAGTVYFLDPSTAGAATSTEPSTTGQISKPVYLATSTTTAVMLNMRGVEVGNAATNDVVLLATASPAAVASADFTNLSSDYIGYRVVISNIIPATDGSSLWMRFSDDGGSTWEADAPDYTWEYETRTHATSPTVTNTGDNADSEITVTGAMGTSANENGGFVVDIMGGNTSAYHHISWQGAYRDSAATFTGVTGTATMLNTSSIEGVQFLFSSGNIETAEIRLYGYKAS